MIHLASNDDINEMKNLWHICFGDDYDYIDFFFSNRFSSNNSLIYKSDGNVVSQLFLLDGLIKTGSGEYKAYYLYAACTHPDYRNQGLMSEMLNFAAEFALKNNVDFICLVPAEKHLFDYYSKFGYKPIFEKHRYTITYKASADNNIQFNNCNNNSISKTRNSKLTRCVYFMWDDKALDYAIKENNFSNGELIAFKSSYAFTRPTDNNKVFVYEICSNPQEIGPLFSLIQKKYNCNDFVIDTPVDYSSIPGEFSVIQNGMACAITPKAEKIINNIKNAYLGLPLE